MDIAALFLLGFLALLWLFIATVLKAWSANRRVSDVEQRVNRLEQQVTRMQFQGQTEKTAPATELQAKTEPEAPAVSPSTVDTFELLKQSRLAQTKTKEPVTLETKAVASDEYKTPEPASAAAPGLQIPPIPPPLPASEPKPASASAFPQSSAARPSPAPLGMDWEQFMGAKLFAWVGGFALFLAVAFFVKYSFDNNLISAEMRVALGFVTGIGLLIGGGILKHKTYEVTAQTLCATGVVVLYTVCFACHSFYHFTAELTTFMLMILVTVTAFLLAVRTNAQVVAILGLVGGFLTPPLLSTGHDNPLGLFGYIAILDLGLMAVALKRRWFYLVGMGAAGTVLMQIGWVANFFIPDKIGIAAAILLGFNLLFLGSMFTAKRLQSISAWLTASSFALPLITMGFVFVFLHKPELGARPWTMFGIVLVADLCLLAITLAEKAWARSHPIGGWAAYALLTFWTWTYLEPSLLFAALTGYVLFAILHSLFPLVLESFRPGAAPAWWGNLFAPVALLLLVLPLTKIPGIDWSFWPFILLLDGLALCLAFLSASIVSILVAMALSFVLAVTWFLQQSADLNALPPFLLLVIGFAGIFYGAGWYVEKLVLKRWQLAATGEVNANWFIPGAWHLSPTASPLPLQTPVFSAAMPFLLLLLAALRLPIHDPTLIFGAALILVAMLLIFSFVSRLGLLTPVAMGCVLALEYGWHTHHFISTYALVPLLWHGGFYLLFTLFPLLCARQFRDTTLPWAAAALSGPLHFLLLYWGIRQGYPNDFIGLLPGLMTAPMLGLLKFVWDRYPADHPSRNTLLAWFAGSALFFITLIFPVQFEKEWITIGWAMEGTALLWLFHRIPHPGLQVTGLFLLALSFVRLALNPEVLHYHVRSTEEIRILNWFLYTYGIVTVCLLTGGKLASPPRNRVLDLNLQPILYTMGVILAFLLLNLEIADYFATGATLTFEFHGNFARDMTYSIAWALFALALLVIGVIKKSAPVRYASVGLFGVTMVKLFFHDLVNLSAPYRIGAFLGVAIISIMASALYQRFFATRERERQPPPG